MTEQTETTITIYAVGHNLPGYLPESTVSYFETFEEAKAYQIQEMEWAADAMQSWANDHDCDDIPCPTYGDSCPWQGANDISGAEQDLNLDNGPEWGVIAGGLSWWINQMQVGEAEAVEMLEGLY